MRTNSQSINGVPRLLPVLVVTALMICVCIGTAAGMAWGVHPDAGMISGWCNEGGHHE